MKPDLSIDLRNLKPEGMTFEGALPAGTMDIEEHDVHADGTIRYDLTVQEMDDGILLTGSAETDVKFRCARCAEFFTRTIGESHIGALIEWPENGSLVDLTGDLREAIILNFPTYPKCSDECLGLCGQCGKNLNQGPCECSPPGDLRWQALENLKV